MGWGDKMKLNFRLSSRGWLVDDKLIDALAGRDSWAVHLPNALDIQLNFEVILHACHHLLCPGENLQKFERSTRLGFFQSGFNFASDVFELSW